MIEVTLRKYLEQELGDTVVVMEKPKNPPSKYVMIQLLDSGRINQVDAVTFNVIIVADNFYEAASLRDDVKDLLFEAIRLPEIAHAGLGGERSGVDSTDHVYRYEVTFNFYYYREETE